MDYAAYEADRKKLAARIVAVRQIIQDTTDPQERIRQTERLRILRGMYKDTLDNLERLRPPQGKTPEGAAAEDLSGRLQLGLFGKDQDHLCRPGGDHLAGRGRRRPDGQAGRSPAEGPPAGGGEAQRPAAGLLFRPCGRTDPGQNCGNLRRQCQHGQPDGCPGGEDPVPHHLRPWRSLGECISPDGVDLLRLATRANLLTLRQREMLYFLLTDGVSIREISEIVHRNRSTVCRSNAAVLRGFAGVCLDMAEAVPRKIARADWPGGSEAEIAAMLGLPKGVLLSVRL